MRPCSSNEGTRMFNIPYRTAWPYLTALLLASGAPATWAADPLTDAMEKAYVPYRTALFQTNSKAQAESVQAIASAQRMWQDIRQNLVSAPPLPYQQDAGLSATAERIGKVYEKAAQEAAAGQLPQAHETLEEARDLMADIRQRNGVVVFSDHMNAYHAEMEHVLIDGPKWLAGPQGVFELTTRLGVLHHLAQRLDSQAPSSLKGNSEFKQLLQAVQKSVDGLRTAVATGDKAAIQTAIGALKGPYSKLFKQFG